MKENKKEYNNDLVLGLSNDKKTPIILNGDSRKDGFIVIGVKNSRKSSYILPTFAKQSISLGNNIGSTYITNGLDDSYLICAVARRMKRKTQLSIIKPSYNSTVYQEILEDKPYDFDRYNTFFDYAKLVRNKGIIVIDAEEYKYKELAKRFIKKIILHMYLSIQDTKTTLFREHHLYVDTADDYIEDLSSLITYGENFNYYITLFLESRDRLNNKDKNIIDINVKNILLLNNIIKEDREYYNTIIKEDDNLDTFFYKICNKNKIEIGTALLASDIKKDDFASFDTVAERIKKEETVADNNVNIPILSRNLNDKLYEKNKIDFSPAIQALQVNESKNENISAVEEPKINQKNAILNNLNKVKEPYDNKKYKFNPTEAQERYIKAVLATEENQKKKAKEKENNQEKQKIIPQTEESHDKINNTETKKEVENKEKTNKFNTEIKQKEEKKQEVVDDEEITVKIEKPIEKEIDEFEEALNNSFERTIESSIESAKEPEIIIEEDDDFNDKDEIVEVENVYNDAELMKADKEVSLNNNDEKENKQYLDLDLLLEDDEE